MIKRVDVPANPVAVISQADFEEDFKRGFCVIEYNPARTETITDHRSGASVTRELEATLVVRCMFCEFDMVAGFVKTYKGQRITGEYCMQEHLKQNKHHWPYSAFKNPYGSVADVIIEGIDGEYAEYINKREKEK